MRRIALAVLLLVALIGPLVEQKPAWASPGWLTGWTYRKAITIDHAYVDADLEYFQILIKWTNDADLGHAQNDGDDIRFTASDEVTLLDHTPFNNSLRWSGGGGSAASGYSRVEVPTIYGASNTTIWMYYGNAGASADGNEENTYEAARGYSAAWHLEESSNPYLDATSNNNDSTAGTYPSQAAGKEGYGQEFNGTTHYIRIADSTSLDIGTSDLTFFATIYPHETSDARRILSKYTGSGAGWSFMVFNTAIYNSIYDGTNTYSRSTVANSILANNWYRVCAKIDRDSTTGGKLYINGAQSGTDGNPTAVGDISNNEDAAIGRQSGTTSSGYFDGIIDEPSLSLTLRSDAWIKFDYRNLTEADNEIAFGPEQTDTAQFTTDTSALNVNEGSTNVFQVKLTKAPGKTINATVSRQSGNTHISIQSGSSLTFNDTNWDTYQTVTLACETHTDQPGKVATIRVHDQASELADKDVTATEVYTSGKYWYVRPIGGSYGTEDGTSYANAWDGLENAVWGASGVYANSNRGDTLWVCGLQVRTFNTGEDHTEGEIALGSGVSNSVRITIRGDYSGDAGIIWGAHKDARHTWNNEGGGVWSTTLLGNMYTDWFFLDVTSGSWTTLDKEYTLVGCQGNAGSHYSVDYVQSSTLYIHTDDGLTPNGRIWFPRYGYWFDCANVSYITFKNIDLYGAGFSMMESDQPKTYWTFDNCHLWYGEGVIWAEARGCHHNTVENCDVAWVRSSALGVGLTGAGEDAHTFTYKNNKIHDVGTRQDDSDAHGIAVQGGHDWIIEGNEIYNCGSGITEWSGTGANFYNTSCRFNYVHDMHTAYGGSSNCRGIEMNIDDNDQTFYNNVVAYNFVAKCHDATEGDHGFGYRYKTCEGQVFYNNVAYDCRISFWGERNGGTTKGMKITIKNNISLSPTEKHVHFEDTTHVAGTESTNCKIDSDYNIFYPISGTQFYFRDSAGAHTVNFTGWQALSHTGCTFDPHGKTDEPKFVNGTGTYSDDDDVKLQSDSPAINAGTNVGLTVDYFGNTVPQGTAPDIGVHETSVTGESEGEGIIQSIVLPAIKSAIKNTGS